MVHAKRRLEHARCSFRIVGVADRAHDGYARCARGDDLPGYEIAVGELLVAELDDVDSAAQRSVQKPLGRAAVEHEIEARCAEPLPKVHNRLLVSTFESVTILFHIINNSSTPRGIIVWGVRSTMALPNGSANLFVNFRSPGNYPFVYTAGSYNHPTITGRGHVRHRHIVNGRVVVHVRPGVGGTRGSLTA